MKTQTELKADSLFAFQMALKGHKQFEFQASDGEWKRTGIVESYLPHRIYHDIPDGWTRHDGEDWKGDPEAVIEEAMYCDGNKATGGGKTASSWRRELTHELHRWRIYAYKLAKQTPVIPEGFTKWDGKDECPVAPVTKVDLILASGDRHLDTMAGFWGWDKCQTDTIIAYRVITKKVVPWTFERAPLNAKVRRKSDGKIYRMSAFPNYAGLYPTSFASYSELATYETLAADYLQLNGEVCGTEEA
jgi:hypothetical protein